MVGRVRVFFFFFWSCNRNGARAENARDEAMPPGIEEEKYIVFLLTWFVISMQRSVQACLGSVFENCFENSFQKHKEHYSGVTRKPFLLFQFSVFYVFSLFSEFKK